MCARILIPLDGSELAECALPYVTSLAKIGLAEEVTILKVLAVNFDFIRLADGYRTPGYTELRTKARGESLEYLAAVASKLHAEAVNVKTELLEDDRAAGAICDYVQKNGIALIVIATHGHTGLKRMMLGSVASEVVHCSHVPVLLIRPESCRASYIAEK